MSVDSAPRLVLEELSEAGVQSTSEPAAPVQPRIVNRWLPLAALLIVVTGVHLATLLRYPPPFVDEGWNASRAWGLLHTGRAFGTLDAGVFQQYPGYWTFFPWLGTAIHAL